jgi:hypothetical protein
MSVKASRWNWMPVLAMKHWRIIQRSGILAKLFGVSFGTDPPPTSTRPCQHQVMLRRDKKEIYRSDTQQTKLPARRSQCVRRRIPPRAIYPCACVDDSFCDSEGSADLTAASLQP